MFVPMMAIIKHTRPISLTAFPLQRTQRLYLCLAVNWSGSIQKKSQPLMKRQYPGKRQNYAKFCTGSKYGEKRSSGERKKRIKGRGRMCGPWQIWKMASWLSNKWPNILMWELSAYMCTRVCISVWGAAFKARLNLLFVPLYCVNMVPLSCIIGPQSDIGTCFSVVSRPLMILSPHKRA